jgi:hypothetical protein
MRNPSTGSVPYLLLAKAESSPAVVQALTRVMTGEPYLLRILTREHEQDLVYELTQTSLGVALDAFRQRELPSVRLEFASGNVTSAVLFSPHFGGELHPWWSLLVELRSGDSRLLFEKVCQTDHVALVALYVEDELGAVAVPVDVDSLNWDDPWLVTAGILGPDRTLVIRPGPAFRSTGHFP